MALGLTPSYNTDLSLDDLTHPQCLVIAIDIASKLGWDIRYKSENGLIAYSGNKKGKWNSQVTIKMDYDMVNVRSESTGNAFFDWGRNKKNVTTFADLFYDAKAALDPEALARKYEALAPDLLVSGEDVVSQPPPTFGKKMAGTFSLLIPKEGYFVTPILIDINILVFLLMVCSGVDFFAPDTESLVNWGANFRPVTLEGQWWRLITNCFLHIGLLHLAFNMFALMYIGVLLEPYLGKLRFAVAYLLTGVIGSVTSLYWHDLTVSAGASGAIFGMYGVFLAMLTTNLIPKSVRTTLLTSIGLFVAYNLLYSLKGGIDASAHIGGLCSGLIIGYLFYPSLRRPNDEILTWVSGAVATILVVGASVYVYHHISNDLITYEQKMKSFARYERRALRIYRMPPNSKKETLLSVISDSGLYYWGESLKLLQEAQRLKIPAQFKERNDTLIEYCQLRIGSYNYLYMTIQQDTDIYKDSLRYFDSRIESMIKNLNAK